MWNNSVWSLKKPNAFPSTFISLSCCCLLSWNCHHSLSDVAVLGALAKLLGSAVFRFCMASWVAPVKVTWCFCLNVKAAMPFIANVIKCHLDIWIGSHLIWNILCLFPHCWPFLPSIIFLSYHPFDNLLFLLFLKSAGKGSV